MTLGVILKATGIHWKISSGANVVRFLFSNHAPDNIQGKELECIKHIGKEQLRLYYSNLSLVSC